jgi:hypothetical protein
MVLKLVVDRFGDPVRGIGRPRVNQQVRRLVS